MLYPVALQVQNVCAGGAPCLPGGTDKVQPAADPTQKMPVEPPVQFRRLLNLRLNSRKRPGAQRQEAGCHQTENQKIDGSAKMPLVNQRAPEAVDAKRQGINAGGDPKRHRQVGEWEDRTGQKENRHNQKVHDQLKALHITQRGADRGAQRSENDGDQGHEQQGDRQRGQTMRPKPGRQAN